MSKQEIHQKKPVELRFTRQELNLLLHALAGLGSLASVEAAAAVGLDVSAAGIRMTILEKLCRE